MNAALAVTGEIPKEPETDVKKSDRYGYWSWTWYEHQNMRDERVDERVEVFASLLWDGV